MGRTVTTSHQSAPRESPSTSHVSRRQLLQALGALSALGGVRCGPALIPRGPFPLGVASGDASPGGALLWTHFAGQGPLSLGVWQGESAEGEPVFYAEAPIAAGGAVRVPVDGLSPGTRYTYGFAALGSQEISALGHFRTALAADALEPLRFGATCCMKHGQDMPVLARAGERTDLDAFLYLGDSVYADGSQTLDQYRAKWERTLLDPGLQLARAAHGLIATWDDHEFDNDYHLESTSAVRFEMAGEAFFEHMPMRRNPDAPNRLWRSIRWGRTAEVFVLDSRGERKPSTRLSPQAEYISPAQLAWLKEGLASSTAAFKLVMTSVPISEFPGALFQLTVYDRWEGFPAQRAELLSFVEQQGIPGVLWVAGDFHLASVGRVSRAGPGSRATEVLIGPGANFSNPSPSYPGPPQFDWSSGINNYAVLELRPQTGEVQVEHFDGSGRRLAVHTVTP